MKRPPRRKVPLNRAMSKLGILSRAEATAAILAGRVRVDGRIVYRPTTLVVQEGLRVSLDAQPQAPAEWRTILLNKPRGVVTTRRDPEGRPTVFDLILGAPSGETARQDEASADGASTTEAQNLVAVGRLDLATTGLLLLTTDTGLANRITDPANSFPRVYIVTVRGAVTPENAARLTEGLEGMRADAVTVRKASGRETHLTVQLREGKNREVRRLFKAIGHEVTRLKRVRLGGLELGELAPGTWRELSREEIAAAFPQ
jgi:23S rRNA pseudouridine2605 synthase